MLRSLSTHWHKVKELKCTLSISLKVPKCEIFHLFDFNEFYGVKSLKVGDLRDEIKN
jgi:hypothetical protein